MSKRHYCIGCGKEAPAHASSKGWELTQIGGKGLGARWYRQCGCLPRRRFLELAEHLFDSGRSYMAKRHLGYLAAEREVAEHRKKWPEAAGRNEP